MRAVIVAFDSGAALAALSAQGPRFRRDRALSGAAPRRLSNWRPKAAVGWHRHHWRGRWGRWHRGRCVRNW
jgi:hypothetical protein